MQAALHRAWVRAEAVVGVGRLNDFPLEEAVEEALFRFEVQDHLYEELAEEAEEEHDSERQPLVSLAPPSRIRQ